ncbi:hypothetical protein [Streptomyces sp. B1I3]|uniref:hypothetical protein n=1 Tax=Streptomyces sp. B1I3 TaxID=3042264 RepID=UPI002782600B|nr:hypothetical protein [Streptomyces sp. B1I3]MDQ0792058.1 hypothetical protein [Streptomyces sp. B1I3]
MTAADLERVDVPLPELLCQVKEMTALKQARTVAALLVEDRHLCDPQDTAFALLSCTCKTPLATDGDYPGFADWVAQQEDLNAITRRRAS